jgi:PAS domain S-box-containing protein
MSDKSLDAPPSKRLFASLLAAQTGFTLVAGAVVIGDLWGVLDPPETKALAGLLVMMSLGWAVLVAVRARAHQLRDKTNAATSARLVDTVLATSREWLWALDDQGRFSFSSPASIDLFGYQPSELVGKHFSIVAGIEDLPDTISFLIERPTVPGHAKGLVRCRRRDGRTVWIDSSTRNRPVGNGQTSGLEGTSRRVPAETAKEASVTLSRIRIRKMIAGSRLMTAFQPIRDLNTGHLVGAEALTRFASEDGTGPEHWFAEAAAAGLSEDLEIAALETALEAAQQLPPCVYVALNVSPATCLDARLPKVLERSGLALERIVLELTERLKVECYSPLLSSLEPLRRRGLRIAVDDAGSGFASMRHVLRLRPDIIKLDRSLIAGIHDDEGQRALGYAMTEFACRIGATIVAEGIETEAELDAVAGLGMASAQGYLLGRPTIDENEWASWHSQIWPPAGRFK